MAVPKTATVWERIGGVRSLVMLIIILSAIGGAAKVTLYRVDRVECDLNELEDDYKTFSKEAVKTMQSIEKLLTKIETRQDGLIDDVKKLDK